MTPDPRLGPLSGTGSSSATGPCAFRFTGHADSREGTRTAGGSAALADDDIEPCRSWLPTWITALAVAVTGATGATLVLTGVLAAVLATVLVLLPTAAGAAERPGGDQGTAPVAVGHVERVGGELRVLLDVDAGIAVDPDSLQILVDEVPLATAGARAADRTVIVALDTSRSMAGNRIEAARTALDTFLDRVPDEVRVGLVTFDGTVTVVAPTRDRAALAEAVEDIELGVGTRLIPAVTKAVRAAGPDGPRYLMVLSDGADTSGRSTRAVTEAVATSGVKVVAISLTDGEGELAGPDAQGAVRLRALTKAGQGSVVRAGEFDLAATFASFGDDLSRQIHLTGDLADLLTARGSSETHGAGEDGLAALPPFADLVVVGRTFTGRQFTTTAYVPLTEGAESADSPGSAADPGDKDGAAHDAAPSAGSGSGGWMGHVGLLLIAAAVVMLLYLFGTGARRGTQSGSADADLPGDPTQLTPAQRAGIAAVDPRVRAEAIAAAAADQVGRGARTAAGAMLASQPGLEARIARRLLAAGSGFKPVEWILTHTLYVLIGALAGAGLGQGNPVAIVFGISVGALSPWLWLRVKTSRRRKAFNAGLADTLSLIAGSLSAGHSLAQSIDVVASEAPDPIAGEFRRVLVETRLGIDLTDALDGVAERFDSRDFAWIVMAIRIQRQVGGNLAELLNTVAGTLREREYLRRQVQTLSAEGRLSCWILGALPVAFLGYLMVARRDYAMVLFTDPRGWVLLGGAALLLIGGIFWMTRLVKVEV